MPTNELKPCPKCEAIAQNIADHSGWGKRTDNYSRIYQAAYLGAQALTAERDRLAGEVAAMGRMIERLCNALPSPSAKHGVFADLRTQARALTQGAA